MATVLTCTQLSSAVATASAERFPPIIQLALQVFACAELISNPDNAGYVYAANYGEVAPVFIPASAGAIATDTVTLQEWQWNGSSWN